MNLFLLVSFFRNVLNKNKDQLRYILGDVGVRNGELVVGAGRPAAGSVLLERPAALKATELRLTGLSYE